VTGLAAAATGRAVRTARQLPGQTAGAAASVAREALSVGQSLRREAAPVSRGLLDLHPARARRRVWSGQGHAHIEVRGMTGGGQQHRRLAAGVTRRMRRLRGVRWAEVNAVTGQVLVAFDEGRVNAGTLLDVVRDVEKTHGTREESLPWSRPVHPSDATPIAAAAVELTADCLAVATAMGARMSRLPPPPRVLRVAHALLELALTAAAIQGLSQSPGTPAVDALYRGSSRRCSKQVTWWR